MVDSATRQRILAAALDCFLENGVHRTTVDLVRKRAAVSNGSFFHHFRSKQDLAEAVYLHGLEQHQAELLATLTPRLSLEAGITSAVRRHLEWVEAHPRLAAFLLGPPDWAAPTDSPRIAACSRAFFQAVADWLRARGWSGTPTLGVVVAVWIGPAQEYTRRWLLGEIEPPTSAAPALARAAWNALEPVLASTPTPEDT
ncbi:TetR/AcrR family transcriptional regulator [Goodfellowiella coeruleoviolacea]|uniref:Transcriptional regulator, TetR family n=1 Tax=Goodfellowiella coeruleoviolacea TaxID=334858 RepID=A0AAE3GKE7_9PSEU|nr:TetR/AcrR family transcriptional regulator [Goodfellowiella coeruleoviolacea]MCP2169861.1 transcriptional regulator, TetR family [Goodfellowiella coeruleoviolacea]